MSDFLERLKNAADTGEFNSEAAQKIIAIHEQANNPKGFTEKDGEKAREVIAKQAVTEEEVLELNSEYEKKMAGIKKIDGINSQLATLIDIEDMVKASIDDMLSFITELDIKFNEDLEGNDPMIADLASKISEIKNKYSINK